jgi:TIR domain
MVDTALSEFGAESVFIEDPMRRTLGRLRTLSDDNLIALSAYLHPESADVSASLEETSDREGPWKPDHFRLFISHTSAHKELAGGLHAAMLGFRTDCFVAHTTIEPTREWEEEIERALRTCHALVALITPDFSGSRWCDQEIGVCYGIGTLVVPVRIGLDPYGFIGKFQALNFAPDREHVVTLRDRLFQLLAPHSQTQSPMVDPVIERFAGSWSWDNTRAAWPFVRALPREAWTDKRLARVREAAENNVEVREAVVMEGGWRPAPEVLERHLQNLGIPPEQSPPDDEIPF